MTSLFSRREFLRTGSLLALTATAPSFLLRGAAAASQGSGLPILVVVQLAGGNDGLNTVVPFADDAYYRARPRLGLRSDEDLVKLNDRVALNSALKDLMPWGERGELAIVEGVGYPNPDRSHFRSTEIWETASDSNQTSATGWIGRYLDNCCPGRPEPTTALAIGADRPQSFSGTSGMGIALSSAESFGYLEGVGGDDTETYRATNNEDMGGAPAAGANSTLNFLRQTSLNATVSADRIRSAARRYKGTVTYPNGRLAQSLQTVARMIAGGMGTRIYYVSHTGFDTHANQVGQHRNLLRQLGESLAAFQKDLEAMGEADRVVTMTFSEFGRRVAENGSGGTDHGTAAPMFLMGKRIGGGLHGTAPSLTNLDAGDLRHTVDFRRIYASVLNGWLGTASEPVLGRTFDPLPGLIRTA